MTALLGFRNRGLEYLFDFIRVAAISDCARLSLIHYQNSKPRESDREALENASELMEQVEEAQKSAEEVSMANFTEFGAHLRRATYQAVQIANQEESPLLRDYLPVIREILSQVKDSRISSSGELVERAKEFFETAFDVYLAY